VLALRDLLFVAPRNLSTALHGLKISDNGNSFAAASRRFVAGQSTNNEL